MFESLDDPLFFLPSNGFLREGVCSFGIRIAFLNIVYEEYAMISAAANMMTQSGELFAQYTPTAEVHAPAIPVARPSLGMQVLFFRCVIQPESEVGIMLLLLRWQADRTLNEKAEPLMFRPQFQVVLKKYRPSPRIRPQQ